VLDSHAPQKVRIEENLSRWEPQGPFGLPLTGLEITSGHGSTSAEFVFGIFLRIEECTCCFERRDHPGYKRGHVRGVSRG
jgi:hypothetical protein